jgi:hypothetical protein
MMPEKYKSMSKDEIDKESEDNIIKAMINDKDLIFEEYKDNSILYTDIMYQNPFWNDITFVIPTKDEIQNIITNDKLDKFYSNLYVNDGKKNNASGIRGYLGFEKAATYCCDHNKNKSITEKHAVGENCKLSENAVCLARLGNILWGPNTSKFRCFSPNSEFPAEIDKLEDKQKNCEVLTFPDLSNL